MTWLLDLRLERVSFSGGPLGFGAREQMAIAKSSAHIWLTYYRIISHMTNTPRPNKVKSPDLGKLIVV